MEKGTPSPQVSRPSVQRKDNQSQGEKMVRGIPQVPKTTKNRPFHAIPKIQERHRIPAPMASI